MKLPYYRITGITEVSTKFRNADKPLGTESDGIKISAQFGNWRQLLSYKGKPLRSIEERPVSDLLY